MSDDPPELSIVLPGYNEREALPAAVAAYCEALPRVGIEAFELILVDDASKDGMGALADELAAEDPRIRVLHHEVNQGQVAGILNGFAAARGRVVTHNGMDLPFDPADSERMLARIRDGADVVVERIDRASYGLKRKLMSWANIALNRVLFRSPFLDHNFVQFFRREVVEGLPVRSRGVSTVTLELIVRAVRAGFRVVGESAPYGERRKGTSTITWKKAVHALAETLKLWRILASEPPREARRSPPPGSGPTPPR